MSPGGDGVLRLDTGRGEAWPCNPRSARAYRAYNALPGAFEMKAARPKSEIKPEARSDSKADSKNAPVQAAKADNNPATADDRRADDGELLRLKDETARLKGEMARLKDEASRLRGETVRLKDQLALRDATESFKTDLGKIEIGKTEGNKAESSKVDVNRKAVAAKGDGKIVDPLPQADAKRPAPEPAPKGDLLTTEPQSSEIHKTPLEKKTEAQLPDEQAFNRQKGVVERAWKQLIDMASRMRKDLVGKPE
ncbi:hypothetical protein [Bradyrhizobium prioriisuperbiae]|uniref:hypothetical protein n=1 Tax=Bradyrhizobium prioriisuperbiae TaxID=2854389 RepID=UPI0028E7EF51|nr:hypothetical protein [Bradyrhizobium prioritasuperba]